MNWEPDCGVISGRRWKLGLLLSAQWFSEQPYCITFPFTFSPLSNLAVAVNPRVETLTVSGPIGYCLPRLLAVYGDLQKLMLLRPESLDVSILEKVHELSTPMISWICFDFWSLQDLYCPAFASLSSPLTHSPNSFGLTRVRFFCLQIKESQATNQL